MMLTNSSTQNLKISYKNNYQISNLIRPNNNHRGILSTNGTVVIKTSNFDRAWVWKLPKEVEKKHNVLMNVTEGNELVKF